MSQYNKLSNFQSARFQLLAVHGAPLFLTALVTWYPHYVHAPMDPRSLIYGQSGYNGNSVSLIHLLLNSTQKCPTYSSVTNSKHVYTVC